MCIRDSSEIIRRPGREGAVLGTAFRMRIGAGAFTAILLFAAIGLTPATRHDLSLIHI